MAGTALAGGVLMALGAMVSRPRPISRPRWLKAGGALAATILGGFMMFPATGAMADCAGTTSITCAANTVSFNYQPTTGGPLNINATIEPAHTGPARTPAAPAAPPAAI